ncbi:MAG: lasso RiPP family leader peptide-containing protein [Mesorhizobium sp.]
MESEDGKLEYQAPELVVHGTIESLTQGQSTGTELDASFPAGTAFGDLTFS